MGCGMEQSKSDSRSREGDVSERLSKLKSAWDQLSHDARLLVGVIATVLLFFVIFPPFAWIAGKWFDFWMNLP